MGSALHLITGGFVEDRMALIASLGDVGDAGDTALRFPLADVLSLRVRPLPRPRTELSRYWKIAPHLCTIKPYIPHLD